MELADRILASVAERQVIKYIVRLQPAGGVGDKVFPPTYPPPRGQEGTRYAEETRWISQGTGDPAPTNCILVDSVPSQGNRLEEHALRSRATLGLPDIQVRFTGLANETPVSVMEAPHRVFDALLRDSELGADETHAGLVRLRLRGIRRIYQAQKADTAGAEKRKSLHFGEALF